jgi:hypothetical protein
LEWKQAATDIREQFPLKLEDTLVLAKEAGIKHPALQGHDYIMTTDFLVDTHSASQPKFAIQAKYAKDMQEPRVVEKLELERRYWRQKSIPWYIVYRTGNLQNCFRQYQTSLSRWAGHPFGSRSS